MVSLALATGQTDFSIEHKILPAEIFSFDKGSPDKSTVTLSLTGSNEVPPRVPIDLVLAIDKSNSMSGSRTNETTSAVKSLLAKFDPKNTKVGLVVWNETIRHSFNLTSKFNESYKNIDKISPKGNTCLSVGLNASINMLKNEKPTDLRVIILISDGEENCNFDEMPCVDAKLAAKLGILIYTVDVGSNKNNLLECIADTSNGTYYGLNQRGIRNTLIELGGNIKNILARNVVVSYAIPRDMGTDKLVSNTTANNIKLLNFNIGTISSNQNVNLSFNLFSSIPGSRIVGIDPFSVITYARYDGTQEAIPITSKTLNINEEEAIANVGQSFTLTGQGKGGFTKDIVTNLTVEKLIVPNGNNTGPRILLRITTPFITKADFVFALDSTGSLFLDKKNVEAIREEIPKFIKALNETSYTNGAKIDARISIISWDDDIDFAYSNITNTDPNKTKMVSLSQALKDIDMVLSDKYYNGNEKEVTLFEVGVNNSMKVLTANPPPSAQKNVTKRFIILVTDRSEFRDCNPNTLDQARKMNFAIYPIGLNPGPLMNESLTDIAQQTKGYYEWCGSRTIELNRVIEDNLNNITQKIFYDNPVANDVVVVDSIYQYLTPDLSTIKNATLVSYNLNSDGTKTMTLYVGNLTPGKVTDVSFDADINIDLPVDVTKSRSSFVYSVHNQTNESRLSYKWFNGVNYKIDLPEGKISIRNGQPKAEKPSASTGMDFGIVTILCLLGIFILRRSKHD